MPHPKGVGALPWQLSFMREGRPIALSDTILPPQEEVKPTDAVSRSAPRDRAKTEGNNSHASRGGSCAAARMLRTQGDSTFKEELHDIQCLVKEQGNGSFLRGWRNTFDPRGELQVDYADFVRVAGSLKWVGNVERLMNADGDRGVLTLNEISPVDSELMKHFMQWIKRKYNSPGEFFAAMDVSRKGKVSRDIFAASLKMHGFQASEQETNTIFDCCDPGDVGTILKEDVIFLELDPAAKQKESLKLQGGSLIRDWKMSAAREYILNAQNVNSVGKRPALPPKHRLAPRAWQASAFEHIPLVVCMRRRDRERQARFRQKVSRQVFLTQIRSIYSNEVRAVRRAVAGPDGCSTTQADLRRYCRKVDLPVSIPDLWRSLDTDTDGTISLEEICPTRATALAKFQVWAYATLGSVSDLWHCEEAVYARARRRGGGGWISDKKMLFSTFSEALEHLGWPGVKNPEERSLLFTSLDLLGCSMITLDDLEWLDRWRAPEYLSAEPDDAAWAELKDLLLQNYKQPLKAWRTCLDKDNSNRISWSEFYDACKQVGFVGNTGGAWRALDSDLSGYITMREYDPPSEELLSSFKEWAEIHFGSVKQCFKMLDSDRSGSVTFSEMKRACHKFKWAGDVRTLFNCLDVDNKRCDRDASTGKRAISLDEIGFLDTWQVEPSAQVASLEDFAAQGEAKRVIAMGASPKRMRRRHMKDLTEDSMEELLPAQESTSSLSHSSRGDFAKRKTFSLADLSEDRPTTSTGTMLSDSDSFLSGSLKPREGAGGKRGLPRCNTVPALVSREFSGLGPCQPNASASRPQSRSSMARLPAC